MTRVSGELRRQVIVRAGGCCEYCLISREDRLLPFHVDHVIAEKHNGSTALTNLCLSCPDCNEYKGSDLASIDPENGEITPLFNPRKHRWNDHFKLNHVFIEPLTPEGRATVFLLRVNTPARLTEREVLIAEGRYPCQPLQ